MLAAVLPLHAEWRLECSRHFGENDTSVFFQTTVSDGRTVELWLIEFDTKKCSLKVVDNPNGGTLSAAMEGNGCLSGVNGNYFRGDRTPLGLVICDGKTLHPLEHAKLLSGVLTVTHDHISLLRTAEYQADPKIEQALQAGPFLVERGVPVPGLNDTRRAERTVVLSGGRGQCALLVCSTPVTLAVMSQILSTPGIFSEMRVARALNLDGGSSTAFWVRQPAYYHREFKTVRNFLGVVVKSGQPPPKTP